MKILRKIVFLIVCSCPLTTIAQTTVGLDSDFGGRFSIGIEKEIVKNLHVSLDEELRFDNTFGTVNRLQTNFDIDYKIFSFLKLGAGYVLINPYNSTDKAFSNTKHRWVFSATGTVKYEKWRIAWKEQIQITHRTGSFNEYQNPQNALTLKSRISAKYDYSARLQPYAFVELRNLLNAPVIVASYDGTNYLTPSGSKTGDAGWFLDGFNGAYINRLRFGLGTHINFNSHNSLNIGLLLDRTTDKVVDANAEGTKLKSYTKEKGFMWQLVVKYVYTL